MGGYIDRFSRTRLEKEKERKISHERKKNFCMDVKKIDLSGKLTFYLRR